MEACQLKLDPDALGRVMGKPLDGERDKKAKRETDSSIDRKIF